MSKFTVGVSCTLAVALTSCVSHTEHGMTPTAYHIRIGSRMFTPPTLRPTEIRQAAGIILFTRAPVGPVETARYMRICQYFVSVIPDADQMMRINPGAIEMITIWPRSDLEVPRSASQTDTAECAAAVAHYAYPLANTVIANLPPTMRPGPSSRGPLLVAWSPTASFGTPRAATLAFDLSNFGRDDLGDAFAFWKSEIERDPSEWNHTTWAQWRLRLAAFANRYGKEIIDAVKLLPLGAA